MKKIRLIALLVLTVVLFSGCAENTQAFNLNEFGFENNGGMYTWVEITDYNFEKGYAELSKNKSGHRILEFKENVVLSGYANGNTLESSSEKLLSFQKLDNDSALIDGEPVLITERIVEGDMLVIKLFKNQGEILFVLKEALAENSNEGCRYYFRKPLEI